MIEFVAESDPDHPDLSVDIQMVVYLHEDLHKEVIIAVEKSAFPIRSVTEMDALIMELQDLREELA